MVRCFKRGSNAKKNKVVQGLCGARGQMIQWFMDASGSKGSGDQIDKLVGLNNLPLFWLGVLINDNPGGWGGGTDLEIVVNSANPLASNHI